MDTRGFKSLTLCLTLVKMRDCFWREFSIFLLVSRPHRNSPPLFEIRVFLHHLMLKA